MAVSQKMCMNITDGQMGTNEGGRESELSDSHKERLDYSMQWSL